VIVIETCTGVSVAPAPRNCGPPESPLQVPPSLVASFCEIRSQTLFSASNSPSAAQRSIVDGFVISPAPVCGSCTPSRRT